MESSFKHSTTSYPLNQLLKKNVKRKWTAECEAAFHSLKEQLSSSAVLAHYDPSLPLKLACDASSYGVGAVISHEFPDGVERPVAYASRTLNRAEKNYPQIEREALAIVFGVKKFHQYVYGRKFILITDHKLLVTILGPTKGLPALAAARLQHWAVNFQLIIMMRNFVLQNSTAMQMDFLDYPYMENPHYRLKMFQQHHSST